MSLVQDSRMQDCVDIASYIVSYNTCNIYIYIYYIILTYLCRIMSYYMMGWKLFTASTPHYRRKIYSTPRNIKSTPRKIESTPRTGWGRLAFPGATRIPPFGSILPMFQHLYCIFSFKICSPFLHDFHVFSFYLFRMVFYVFLLFALIFSFFAREKAHRDHVFMVFYNVFRCVLQLLACSPFSRAKKLMETSFSYFLHGFYAFSCFRAFLFCFGRGVLISIA